MLEEVWTETHLLNDVKNISSHKYNEKHYVHFQLEGKISYQIIFREKLSKLIFFFYFLNFFVVNFSLYSTLQQIKYQQAQIGK